MVRLRDGLIGSISAWLPSRRSVDSQRGAVAGHATGGLLYSHWWTAPSYRAGSRRQRSSPRRGSRPLSGPAAAAKKQQSAHRDEIITIARGQPWPSRQRRTRVRLLTGYGTRVSLSQPGETVTVLGPNGAGKSTAVDTMLGLRTPTSGEVRILGGSPAVAAGRIGGRRFDAHVNPYARAISRPSRNLVAERRPRRLAGNMRI